jgi:hypothetical protein
MTDEKLMAIVSEALLDATAPFSRPKDPLSMKEFCLSFASRVAAAEREACLQVCKDIWRQESDKHNIQTNVLKCIEAIRARGQG